MAVLKNASLMFLDFISYAILARVILSWIPMNKNRFTDVLYGLTDPLLVPVQKFLNKSSMFSNLPVDFSPIFTFMFISIIKEIVWNYM